MKVMVWLAVALLVVVGGGGGDVTVVADSVIGDVVIMAFLLFAVCVCSRELS